MPRLVDGLRAAWQHARVPWQTLLLAVSLVMVVAAVVGILHLIAGQPAAMSAYFGVLLLIAPARRLPVRGRMAAGIWTILIACLGFLIGPFGLTVQLIVLVAVCLVQGLFRIGDIASVTRSPVNLVIFSTMSESTAHLWQVLTGTAVAVGIVLLVGRLLQPAASAPVTHTSPAGRLREDILLAIGCVLIVVAAEVIHFDRVTWMLLSLCMVMAVEPGARAERAWGRILGTIVGTLAATAASMLPTPLPTVLAVVSAVFCVAYIRRGEYTLFVVFLTPAILLTASGASSWILAVQRIEAVGLAAILALALTAISARAGRHLAVKTSTRRLG